MNIFEITSKVIHATHGWAVAEQFDDTFGNTGELENQNPNALLYIKETVDDLVEYGPFDEDAIDELNEYLSDLRSYLNANGID